MSQIARQIHASATVETDHLGPGVKIGEKCRVGRNAILGSNCQLDPEVFVGERAEIANGLRVGFGAHIEPGAVVLQPVPPWSRVAGAPASIVEIQGAAPAGDKLLSGARYVSVPVQRSPAGTLTFLEESNGLPFLPKRYFTLSEMPPGGVRGSHAHRRCMQYFACLFGTVAFVLDDGRERQWVRLSAPERGLFVPTGIWVTVLQSQGAAVMVLASEAYDESDYIRDYLEFRRSKGLE